MAVKADRLLNKKWAVYIAHWAGFTSLGMDQGEVGDRPETVGLFHCLNWPWPTLLSVGAVLMWGSHWPALSEGYVIAGLAGAATIARVAPVLAQVMAKSPVGNRPGMQRSVSLSAIAGRRALGWVLFAILMLPWITSGHTRIDWLLLVVPASFAGRALWEPWWWRLSWTIAQRLT